MSFTPGFAPDARSLWLSLGPAYQEMALDELEHAFASPPPTTDHVATAVHEEAGMLHHVFVHMFVSHSRKSITIVGVGYPVIPLRS